MYSPLGYSSSFGVARPRFEHVCYTPESGHSASMPGRGRNHFADIAPCSL